VTPRMGSLGAGSTWPNSDDAIALAACSLDGCICGRRVKQEAARDSAAMPGRRWRSWAAPGRGRGRKAVGFLGLVSAPLVFCFALN
jgi:hypothetical protein